MTSDHYSARATELLFEALDHNRPSFMTVRSDSMAPLLRRGDKIQIGPVAADELAIGDVIVFGDPKDLVAHRFWGVHEVNNHDFMLTRGDRLVYYDPLTTEKQLRAIVIGRRRSGRLLALSHGFGARLNRGVAQLARLEARALRIPLPADTSSTDQVAKYGLARRLVRRLLYTSAYLMTSLVNYLPE